jgi:hypothetical protein
MADGVVGVAQAAAPDRLIDNTVTTNGAGQTVYRQRVELPAQTGAWGYQAAASGTITVAAGRRVIGIAAHSAAGGSFTINGGDAVIVPSGSGISITPLGNLVAPVLVFTGTDSAFVESVL